REDLVLGDAEHVVVLLAEQPVERLLLARRERARGRALHLVELAVGLLAGDEPHRRGGERVERRSGGLCERLLAERGLVGGELLRERVGTHRREHGADGLLPARLGGAVLAEPAARGRDLV